MNWKSASIAFVVILVLDLIWFKFVAGRFYLEQVTGIGRISEGAFAPVIWAALVVYLCLGIGAGTFVDPLVRQADSLWAVACIGSLFGFVVYGVYDFTNLAILKDWPLKLVLVDVAWGSFINAVAALAIRWAAGK